MNGFTGKIKSLREKNKYTQKEISEKLGLSLSGYRKIEYGERDPNLSVLVELAKIYDVTTDYLLGLTDVVDEISHKFKERSFTVMKAKNDMLMSSIHYERFKRTEGENSPATLFAERQYIETKGHYSKLLYEYMVDYFYQDHPNPNEDIILEDKFPINFKIQKDLFDGVTVNVICADGTEIGRVAYYSGAIYEDSETKSKRYIEQHKKHFRML